MDLVDYLNRSVVGELRSLPGVGRPQRFAAQRALRVWIDPDKMGGLAGLHVVDCRQYVGQHNIRTKDYPVRRF